MEIQIKAFNNVTKNFYNRFSNSCVFKNNKSKFKKLNISLKRIILEYLPLFQLTQNIFNIDKACKKALYGIKIFKILKQKFLNFQKVHCLLNIEWIKLMENLLSEYKLSEYYFIEICTFILLKKKDNCKRLYLKDINKDLRIMKILKEFLNKNNLIEELDLGWNNIGININNMKYLSEVLKASKNIYKLVLYNNSLGINIDNMKYLKDALIENTSIFKLMLGWNQIGSNQENIKYLKEALLCNKTIQIVDLRQNNISYDQEEILKNINPNIIFVERK